MADIVFALDAPENKGGSLTSYSADIAAVFILGVKGLFLGVGMLAQLVGFDKHVAFGAYIAIETELISLAG